MESFVTKQDVIDLWRALKPEEIKRVEALIPIISNSLREEAKKVGRDLDKMYEESESFKSVVKSVTVDVVARALMTSTDSEPMIQESQSGLGYSWSGTFLVPGGGLFIKKSELARLGFKRQRIGARNIWGE